MFSKQHRLGKTTDVQRVFAQGRAFFNPVFTIKFLAKPGQLARFTVVASAKVSKSAVRRNRLKRLVREFIQTRMEKFKPGDYAVVLKPAAARRDEKQLIISLGELCKNSRIMSIPIN